MNEEGDVNIIFYIFYAYSSYCFFVMSVYNAMGQTAYDMYYEVDFDQWLTSSLLPELQITHPK